jgi:hypothetical protein
VSVTVTSQVFVPLKLFQIIFQLPSIEAVTLKAQLAISKTLSVSLAEPLCI